MPEVRFWQGNEALAYGALAAGCRFFAGYPITPSSEIAEIMASELPRLNGRFIQMEDEIAGVAAVIGASIAGKKTLTATSGPGFSLKQENLGLAYMAEIPIVVVDVMRGGPSTGVPTKISQQDVMQARWGTHGDHATICYSPSSVQECFELAIRAFNAAERFRQPVLIMSDEVLGHMREKIVLPEPGSYPVVNRKRPVDVPEKFVPYRPDPQDDLPCMASFGDGYTWHVTGLTHNDWGFPTNNSEEIERKMLRLMRKVDRFRDDIVEYETENVDDADVIVLSFGSVARSSLRAVREARSRGLRAGYFRPITLWPFPDKEIERLARKTRTIIVPELNCGQMVLEVERAVHGKAKVVPLNLVNGELFHPEDILSAIEEVA
ncbi:MULTISPECIES: 2-oxoacid:acceptor oxidoreductase subunit alpha [Aminobacterium]|jgi:2-oxoglutarate ferredoxin oxidoreductase subunit alpha|uniref:Pyruvate flavodoxin/ferredoxin oxidoreductase domain protein n=1 Tax=Aminobacterium colombiense (strain DSM 12261 / ALA-1) TaxID=572547 RepID=D5EEE6_AMICL|nr:MULTISPECIES: 2-oxoacid:acceptor oxidoreductase subunit alpha [Aminobacterium]MDD2379444.1 2-oxoacid:acceptor oxidoreductase subunit alpha [Aminobacterium colombiense]ADE56928.1 pyruvate flavodoxin/ferredoxin oxidoreductase domain protein [Aminobacterium colombiense DSM 12261]MDD3767533.1 2-oxoacid:acceptor oxidoreductase subunit alpha [Aminobacterium colombiense]MDD4266117.1 2-oxoacid:acceptor oxidoreductase subunit alpha [Aminobacterium colombiense]MDD4586312.1 2-oxoacid:acceptor oxidored